MTPVGGFVTDLCHVQGAVLDFWCFILTVGAKIELKKGIKKTVDWYIKELNNSKSLG